MEERLKDEAGRNDEDVISETIVIKVKETPAVGATATALKSSEPAVTVRTNFDDVNKTRK